MFYDVLLIYIIVYYEWSLSDTKIIYMSSKKFSSCSTFYHKPVDANTLLDYMRTRPTWGKFVTVMYGFHSLQVNCVSSVYLSRCSGFVLSFQHAIFCFLQEPLCKISYSQRIRVSISTVIFHFFQFYIL